MYKVVIVDDEPIIAEGLSKVVPWDKYGCRIAATAGNGQEGLEVIRKRAAQYRYLRYLHARHGRAENDRCPQGGISGDADIYSDRLPGFRLCAAARSAWV